MGSRPVCYFWMTDDGDRRRVYFGFSPDRAAHIETDEETWPNYAARLRRQGYALVMLDEDATNADAF